MNGKKYYTNFLEYKITLMKIQSTETLGDE